MRRCLVSLALSNISLLFFISSSLTGLNNILFVARSSASERVPVYLVALLQASVSLFIWSFSASELVPVYLVFFRQSEISGPLLQASGFLFIWSSGEREIAISKAFMGRSESTFLSTYNVSNDNF